MGDLLAHTIDPNSPPNNYLFAVGHPDSTLARLISVLQCPRIYTSYNISSVRLSANQRNIVDSFRKRCRLLDKVVFDPLTIDELPPVKLAQGMSGKETFFYNPRNDEHHWPRLPARKEGEPLALAWDEDLWEQYPLSIPAWELKSASRSVEAQIHDRDFRLIDQAHYLVVYRPTLSEPRLSPGVSAEVEHARHIGCPVIWYLKKGTDLPAESPFIPAPGSDPHIFYEEAEDRFWEYLATLRFRSEGDHFLR